MTEAPRPRLNKSVLLVALAGIVALVGGILLASTMLRSGGQVAPETMAATYIPGGKPITDFQLVDHSSQPFDNSRLQGQWTFLFFGYTFCPDVCPTTLATMANVESKLAEAAPQTQVQNLFVSVDPQRDTPARLAQYVPYFSSDFIGATAGEQELTKLTRDLGILYRAHTGEAGAGNYLVDHSSAVLLINPQGQLQAVFAAPHNPQAMVQDFLRIRDFYQDQ
jgi:protein SCO1/2